jgi:beta-glucosidase-like glycosyl hydrolase
MDLREGRQRARSVARSRESGLTAGVHKSVEQIIAQAVEAGVDLKLVKQNLALSPDERAIQHHGALALVLELERIAEDMRRRMARLF